MTSETCGAELGRRASVCIECTPGPVTAELQQTAEITRIVATARGRFDEEAAPPAVAELAVPGWARPAIAPPRSTQRPVATWHIVTADGARHPIHSGTVIGRSPMHTAGRPRYTLLPLTDPTKSLSKTHALIEPHGDYCVVENLGATNGVIVKGADGNETDAAVGVPVEVRAGAVLQLGGFMVGIVRD